MKTFYRNIQYLVPFWGLLFLLTQCETYKPTFSIKVVNLKDTTQNIPGAKVIVQGQTETADSNGIVVVTIDLDRFILDRVEVTANAKGYKDLIGNILVGKDQQETAILKMEPRNRLVYTPDSLVIGPNEVFKEIKVKNLGLDSIPVDYFNNNLSWVNLQPQKDVIRADKDGFLKVTANIAQQNCRVDGTVFVNWTNGGQQQSDPIPVTKIITDTQKPFPTFSVSPGTIVTQHQEITFNANGSTDNCMAYFPLQYNWKFDNNNQTGFDVGNVIFKHSYPEVGVKKVYLIVRDGAGLEADWPMDITVIEQPTPPDIAKTVSATAGQNLLSVVLNGTIYSFGQTFNSLTDHGFVYSTVIDMPTLENGGTPISIGQSSASPQQFTFSETVTNLQPKRHYFRAYAKNSGFPAVYSDPVVFDVKIVDFIPVGGNGGSLFQAQRGDNDAAFPNQKPQSQVYLNNFQIAETEVTNEQYVAFLNGNNIPPNQTANFIALGNSACKVVFTNKYSVVPGFEKHPAITVSWNGANAFCSWVNGRLPTEAEWEAAARSGNAAVYPQWAGSTNSPGLVAVYNGNANQLLQVRQRERNDWGLYDMSGNAAEWCSDWYASQYTIMAPGEDNNPQGPPAGNQKVFRGGSFLNGQEQITVTYRNREFPIALLPYMGFRVVRN